MKASRFSHSHKAFILKQGDEGVPVAEICRKIGISSATYINRIEKYAGLLADEMRRLKALEDETYQYYSGWIWLVCRALSQRVCERQALSLTKPVLSGKPSCDN